MIRQIRRQPIQQIRVPRLLIHLIDRFDNAATEEFRPEPIDDRARESAVTLAGHELGKLLHLLRPRRIAVDLAELWIEKFHRRDLPRGISQRYISIGLSANTPAKP